MSARNQVVQTSAEQVEFASCRVAQVLQSIAGFKGGTAAWLLPPSDEDDEVGSAS